MADWSHKLQNEWGAQFPLSVNGKRQSPIDIRLADATKETLPPFKLELIAGNVTDEWTLSNNGHTVTVAPPAGVKWQLSGSILEGNYILDHFHSHWGHSKGYGSEHLLDGQKFDGETHFVFKWAPDQGKETEDAAVAFGFLMTEGDSTTGAAKNVIEGVLAPNLDKITKVGSVKIPGIDLKSLAETRAGEEYFAYKGSLTTPPFAECVIHVVFKNPLTVTKELMDKLRNLDDLAGGKTTINYRAIQPLMNRKIHHSVS
jgi:carbonic anhydrase